MVQAYIEINRSIAAFNKRWCWAWDLRDKRIDAVWPWVKTPVSTQALVNTQFKPFNIDYSRLLDTFLQTYPLGLAHNSMYTVVSGASTQVWWIHIKGSSISAFMKTSAIEKAGVAPLGLGLGPVRFAPLLRSPMRCLWPLGSQDVAEVQSCYENPDHFLGRS